LKHVRHSRIRREKGEPPVVDLHNKRVYMYPLRRVSHACRVRGEKGKNPVKNGRNRRTRLFTKLILSRSRGGEMNLRFGEHPPCPSILRGTPFRNWAPQKRITGKKKRSARTEGERSTKRVHGQARGLTKHKTEGLGTKREEEGEIRRKF